MSLRQISAPGLDAGLLTDGFGDANPAAERLRWPLARLTGERDVGVVDEGDQSASAGRA
jgi:hypothetical protein